MGGQGIGRRPEHSIHGDERKELSQCGTGVSDHGQGHQATRCLTTKSTKRAEPEDWTRPTCEFWWMLQVRCDYCKPLQVRRPAEPLSWAIHSGLQRRQQLLQRNHGSDYHCCCRSVVLLSQHSVL